MAEELNRSLTMLAKRGVPRGAERVLEDARHRVRHTSSPTRVLRPVWVAGTAFAATLLVLGGSLALGIAVRQPALDVGSVSEAVGEVTASTSGQWLLIPGIAVAVAVAALIVRTQQIRTHEEAEMTTTIERAPAELQEAPKHNNRGLIVAVIVLAAALVALGAWVIYDQASEPETAASTEITELYDAYVAAWTGADMDAFLAVTTEDYILNSFGMTIPRDDQAMAIASAAGQLQNMERIGDLVVMSDGLEYYVGAAEQVMVRGTEAMGISAFRVVETPAGLKIAEHSWVGSI